jgi:hypothetical protein
MSTSFVGRTSEKKTTHVPMSAICKGNLFLLYHASRLIVMMLILNTEVGIGADTSPLFALPASTATSTTSSGTKESKTVTPSSASSSMLSVVHKGQGRLYYRLALKYTMPNMSHWYAVHQ